MVLLQKKKRIALLVVTTTREKDDTVCANNLDKDQPTNTTHNYNMVINWR
jgi:hypothetical protein